MSQAQYHLDRLFYRSTQICLTGSNCYHGTRHAALTDIIECGHLLVPGNRNHRGVVVVPPGIRHDDDTRHAAPAGPQQDQFQIFTSPSIAYVSDPAYAETISYRGDEYNVS